MKKISRRQMLATSAALGSLASTSMLRPAFAQDVVKVGILHSLTGTIALAEASVVDAEKLAIDEVNAAGGVLGKKIEAIVEDGASDWPTFAEKARKLLERDKVAAVFGCYTSASRKAVLPVFEKSKGLLYYPTYYEGLEQSPNILYTAQEATQSVIAAVNWLIPNTAWQASSRGVCLVTEITATVKTPNGNIVATPYSSSGTSYSQFAIIQTGANSFEVTRRVSALEDAIPEGHLEPTEKQK